MAETDLVPANIRDLYEVHEWRHASAILRSDFPGEWDDIMTVLGEFRLLESDIRAPGGGKSRISQRIDERFKDRGWEERSLRTTWTLKPLVPLRRRLRRLVPVAPPAEEVPEQVLEDRTHKVDLFKNRIALEVEWNNKDTFFDRDLYNFSHLFDINIVSVGVIVTRSDHLQEIFNDLGEGGKYGASTTHMGKLLPKIQRGGAGGCPTLVLGITRNLYVPGE